MAKLTRREFLKAAGITLAGSVAVTSTYLAINNESNQVSIERIQIPVKNLHAAMEGFTIAQLSDIHLYPYTRPELIIKAVAAANNLQPDLVVLTGDYVWRNLNAIFDLAPMLSKLNAKHGIFAVIGNHDIWLNSEVIKLTMKREGIPFLDNQGVLLSQGKGNLYLAGLDDAYSGNPNINTALDNAPPDVPVVLLIHEPDMADIYSLDGRVSLQLSGHSHGGQVRVQGIGAFILPYLGRKYDFGLYKVNGMWLYTNRGIGNISVPVRYNCPPEVSEFTLVRA